MARLRTTIAACALLGALSPAGAFAAVDSRTITPVLRAGDFSRIARMIDSGGAERADIAAQFMCAAAFEGNIAILEKLIAKGIPVDAAPKAGKEAGRTALMFAISGRRLDTVRWLLARGAKVDFVGVCDETDCLGHAAIAGAARLGDAAYVRVLLEAGADPTVAHNRATQHAFMEGHVEIYEMLTARGGREWPQHPFARKYPDKVPAKTKPAPGSDAPPLPGVAELLPHAAAASPATARDRCRLAILADGPNEGVADLLAAELSGGAGLELVERQQLARVLAEQRLTHALAAEPANLAKLGNWLRADALLLVQKRAFAGKEAIETRFVRVHPGIVLDSSFTPAPLAQPVEFARSLAPRVRTLAERVLRPDALAVSLLSVRASVSAHGGSELENLVGALLAQRLAQRPEFVLLERAALDALTAEATDDFWTGKYLVSADLDPALDGSGRFDLRLHFRPAGGGAPQTASVSGIRTAPATAVDAALQAISTRLGVAPAAAPAKEEAQRFADVAANAMRLGLYRQAREAANSAWALGLRSIEVARMRMQAVDFGQRKVLNEFGELVAPYRSEDIWLRIDHFRHPLRRAQWPAQAQWVADSASSVAAWRETLPAAQAQSAEALRDWLEQIKSPGAAVRAAFLFMPTARDKLEFREPLTALREAWRQSFDEAETAAATLPDAASEIMLAAEKLYHASMLEPDPARQVELRRALLAKTFRTDNAFGRTAVRERLGVDVAEPLMKELLASPHPEDRLTAIRIQRNKGGDKYGREAMQACEEMIDAFCAVSRVIDVWIPVLYSLEQSWWPADPSHPIAPQTTNASGRTEWIFPAEYRACARRIMTALFERGTDLGHTDRWVQTGVFTPEDRAALLPLAAKWQARLGPKDPRVLRSGWSKLLAESALANTGDGSAPLRFERTWNALSFAPKGPGSFHLLLRNVTLAEDALWIFGARYDRGRKAGTENAFLFRVQIPSLRTETFPLPSQPWFTDADRSQTPPWGSRATVVRKERVHLFTPHFTGLLDRATRQWTLQDDLPLNRSASVPHRLPLLGDDAYYVYSDGPNTGVLRHNLQTGARTLLTSKRRQPAQHPLDEPDLVPIRVSTSERGEVLVETAFSKATNSAPAAKSPTFAYQPAAGAWRTLTEEEARAEVKPYSMRGEGFRIGRLAALGPAASPDSALALIWKTRVGDDPAIPLAFAKPAGAMPLENEREEIWKYFPTVSDVVALPAGVLLAGALDSPGFWFLPRAEYDAYVRARGLPPLFPDPPTPTPAP